MGGWSMGRGPAPFEGHDNYGLRMAQRPFPRLEGGLVGEPDIFSLGNWQRFPGIQTEEPYMFSRDCSGSQGHAAVPIPGTEVESGLHAAFPRTILEQPDPRIRGRVLALGRFISELRDSFYLFHSLEGPSTEAAQATSVALEEAFLFSRPLLSAIVFDWYPATHPPTP